MTTTGRNVRRCSLLSLLLVACSQPTEQAPVAWETNLRVVILGKTGAPIPDATVALLVWGKTANPTLLDSASGPTDADGAYSYRRSEPLGGRYPIIISVSPPAATGMPLFTVGDSTEWEPHPARARTLTLYLQR